MNDATKTEIETAEKKRERLIVHDDGAMAAFLDTALFEQIQRVGQLLSASTCIPESFQNNPANCAVAVAQAKQLGVNVLQLMTKMYVVHGRPGIEAQFKIALANTRGPFDGPIDWKVEGEGKTRSWTAFARMKNSGRIVDYKLDWSTVEAEGWNKPKENKKTGYKQTSKWETLADKMGRYRSASYLIDLYCPEVTLGMMTTEELEEIEVNGERLPAHEPIRQPRRKVSSLPNTPEESAALMKQIDEKVAKDMADSQARIDAIQGTAKVTITATAPQDAAKRAKIIQESYVNHDSGKPGVEHDGAPLVNGKPLQDFYRDLDAEKPAEKHDVETADAIERSVAYDPATGEITEEYAAPTPTVKFTGKDAQVVTTGVARLLHARMNAETITQAEFVKRFGKLPEELLNGEVKAVEEWIANPAGNAAQ